MEEDTKKLFEIGVNELPSHIPLFPLDNVLLLPFGKMPLNIFETRYVKMVLDSLKKQRLIGIVQPKDNSGEFFNIGCMGKITSFIETPDNRIVLNLDGVCRFKITDSQLSQGGYYNANVETIDFVEDINVVEPMIDRDSLIKKFANFFKIKKYDLDLNIIEETSNLQLLSTLTMLAPFNKIDKQAILEAQNLIDRLQVVNSILDLNTFTVVGSNSRH
ncbi:MAG: LON peptidase substrate-binding domain-containing protein [Alphaproteobacteria bacterium]|jgi:Lon protease-like protein|nr:LON peptidase substrate-binding domain-containing protein [Alphaproteobacteria bacterium]